MRHIHADLMIRIAEDTSLRVFYKDGGDWLSVDLEDITWSPECQYKIEEPRTAPVMPKSELWLRSSDQSYTTPDEALAHAIDCQRKEIEAYWKALDEFNGVKA